MNFFTLIFNKQANSRKWIFFSLKSTLIISLLILTVNIIIDPYNITSFNMLKIKHKFARDDRTEKLNYFNMLPEFDNILVGSSRVYTMNPNTVSNLLGGTTYNFGVGTATVEDHLGILKYLERTDKLPTNLIIGVDFYTFNPDTPANKYFIKNKELNFLSFNDYNENYIGKFFSTDALRASYKTMKNHLFNKNEKPRFDKLGLTVSHNKVKVTDQDEENAKIRLESMKEIGKIYSNLNYTHIDSRRVKYYNEIRNICKKNNINLYIFTTPLHPILLNILYSNPTKNALNEYIDFLSTFNNFTNLYYHKDLYNNTDNFNGATHTTTNAGDISLQIILNEKNQYTN